MGTEAYAERGAALFGSLRGYFSVIIILPEIYHLTYYSKSNELRSSRRSTSLCQNVPSFFEVFFSLWSVGDVRSSIARDTSRQYPLYRFRRKHTLTKPSVRS